MNTNTLEHRTHPDPSLSTWELQPSLREDGGRPISTAINEANNREIEAYEKGREVGYSEGRQEAQRDFNLILERLDEMQKDLSARLAHQVLAMLSSHGYRYNEVHLRTRSLSIYEMLVEVDEAAFVSDEFLEVIVAAGDLEEGVRSTGFYPTINFISINFDEINRINYKALIGDGYIYRLHQASAA